MDMSWVESGNETQCRFAINGKDLFIAGGTDPVPELTKAIVKITSRTTLRIGDIVALPLGSGAEVAPGDTLTIVASEKSVDIKIF